MRRKLPLIIAGLFTAAILKAQVAGIKATPTSGCSPLTVVFQSTSTGATSWNWNFGDIINNTANTPNATHTYNSPGTYTVTLTINGGSTATQTIIVNSPPTVKFAVSDSTGCFPLNVQFYDQSTPGSSGAAIVNWRWDFGDGVIDTTGIKNPSHIYNLANPTGFPVTLQVVDANGCSGVVPKTKYIVIQDGVSPSFDIIASVGCKSPITVNLNNTSSSPTGYPVSYTWSFGDGSPNSNATSPPHTYLTSGNYNIKLVVASQKGCSDSLTKIANIVAGNVSSSFTAPDSVCVNTPINFNNTSTPTPTISNWNFGDGTSSNAIDTTKIYTTAGIYNVKLTNTFGSCIDSFIKKVVILNPAVANFSASPLVSCDSLFTVNFIDQSTGASKWLWNFGDGTTSSQQNPTHTYKGYGNYNITLTVYNASNCGGTITKNQYIKNAKPTVQLSQINAGGCIPYSFTPILTDSTIDGIKSYLWDFGDGTTSTSGVPPTHVYNNVGTYPVKLTITTNGGCTATTVDTVKVGSIKPIVNFTAIPTNVCVNSPVSFTDKSTNNPDQWYWTFGDNGISTQQNPTYQYTLPGTFIVTLRAYNHGCNDSAKTTITVNPPLAAFTYNFSCSNNQTAFIFHDSSIGANSWTWDFGDGTTSTLQNPSHIFSSGSSSYTIKLTVTNSSSGCSNSTTNIISTNNSQWDFNPSASKTCVDNPINVIALNSNNTPTLNFYYDFGDGTIDTLNSIIAWHSYSKAGTYTIKMIVVQTSGCTDTIIHTNAITVGGAKADFTPSTLLGCNSISEVFTDKSTSDGIHPIKQWIWDFGDGSGPQTYTSPPFSHNYTKQGIYSVKLTVSDGTGCSDSIVKTNLLTVAQPSAIINAVDSLSCPGSPVQFVNNSKGYGLTYTWDFGDGNTSTATNPNHIYSIGSYTASLKVVDQYGCTATSNNYNIVIDTPYASFIMNDTFASCPPLIANFTFTGSYYKSLRWDFGDGGISNLVNPKHFYTLPGTYLADLIVTSHGGCTDTAFSKTITVLGPNGNFDYTPLQGCHQLTVNFTLTTSDNVTKYFWIFDSYQSDSSTAPNFTFTYDSIGTWTPTVILQNSTGCNVPIKGQNPIVVSGSKPKFGVDKTVLCDNGSVQFTDSSYTVGTVAGYYWDFGDGNISSVHNPSHYYASPGLYSVKLIVTMQTNCEDSIIMNNLIKVVASPSIGITGDVEKCVPASMNFQGVILVADTSAFKWHWNFANGKTDSVINPVSQIYSSPGSYTVQLTATNSSNCATTVSQIIKIDSIPITNAGIDTAICVGQNAYLHASSSMFPASYNWLPPTNGTLSCTSCSNPVATPTVNTTYYVQTTNAYGCSTTDSVLVMVVHPSTLNLTPLSDSLCLGQQVQLIASGEQVYTWTPSAGLSNPSVANPVASPNTSTVYTVTASDSIYCFVKTASVNISVFPYPTVNIGQPVVSIPVGTSYQINGNGSSDIVGILWQPAIGLSCTDCLSPIAEPVNTTIYSITVTNNGGCSTSDSVKIIVTCDGGNLFVPNTFSPNGDGSNDWFYVQGKGLSNIQSMQIFNRWGQLVFEKKNFTPNVEQNGWDGNFNGKKAPSDVYIYTIEVICQNSQLVAYHGNVTLIR
ncbi:MAG TPA: PKD domain-containing protein [Puia sp.]|nr:PKD domain-containing protein [Puia sp.]